MTDKETLVCKFYGFVSGNKPEDIPIEIKETLSCLPCNTLATPLIIEENTKNPNLSIRQLAIKFGVDKGLVQRTLNNNRPKGNTVITI